MVRVKISLLLIALCCATGVSLGSDIVILREEKDNNGNVVCMREILHLGGNHFSVDLIQASPLIPDDIKTEVRALIALQDIKRRDTELQRAFDSKWSNYWEFSDTLVDSGDTIADRLTDMQTDSFKNVATPRTTISQPEELVVYDTTGKHPVLIWFNNEHYRIQSILDGGKPMQQSTLRTLLAKPDRAERDRALKKRFIEWTQDPEFRQKHVASEEYLRGLVKK